MYKAHATRMGGAHLSEYIRSYNTKPSFPRHREFRPIRLGSLGPKLPGPIDHILQLFKGYEDQNCRWLQPDPGGHPALEYEHRTFVAQRVLDHLQRRLGDGSFDIRSGAVRGKYALVIPIRMHS